MMKNIIIDTNVFVSGIFWSGPPYEILKAWQSKKIKLVVTPKILEEYQRVGDILSKKYQGIDISFFIDLLTVEAEMCADIELKEPVSIDPDDDKFIACSLSSKSFCIVSGDKHLLDIHGYQGVKVFKPREFLKEYLR